MTIKRKIYESIPCKEYNDDVDSVFDFLEKLFSDNLTDDEISEIHSAIKHKFEEIYYIPYVVMQEIWRFNNNHPDRKIYF